MSTRVIETHVSTLFLVDDLVYKRKRPVDLGFCDFRDLSARQRACEEEVRLNRRLSPDVYLGVSTLLDPEGVPCEALVVMRRLPEERRLTALLGTADGDQALDAVAHQLADLHRDAEVPADLREHASARRLADLWTSAVDVVAGRPQDVPPHLVDGLRAHGLEWLQAHAALIDLRADVGRVVEGHGDLLADDVFATTDGVRVLDCLEFDQGLRILDGLHDACSLVADLSRLGHDRAATRFVATYRSLTGDAAPVSLQRFFVAYRSLVRAKVACLRAAEGDPHAGTEALLLSAQARDQLDKADPRLVLVGGLPGSGKSTIARGLADALTAELLSSDRARRDRESSGRDGHEAYEESQRSLVYAELTDRAGRALRLGRDVVVDATFGREAWRRALRQLGEELHVHLTELECTVPDEVAVARLRGRGRGDSDATPEVRAGLAADWEDWPQARPLDCRRAPQDCIASALALLS